MSLLEELKEEISKNETREKDVYFPPEETFTVSLVSHEEFTTDEGDTFFKIKAKVEESSTEDIKTGMVCTQMIKKIKKYKGLYTRNVKDFLLPAIKSFAVQNGEDEPNDDEVMGHAAEALENIELLAGTKLYLKTEYNKNKSFTLHNWIKAIG